MYKKALRLTACGLASALLITGSNTTTYAAPVAGVTSAMEVGASNDTLVAGFSLTFSNYMASSELVAKANVATAQNNDTPVVTEGMQHSRIQQKRHSRQKKIRSQMWQLHRLITM